MNAVNVTVSGNDGAGLSSGLLVANSITHLTNVTFTDNKTSPAIYGTSSAELHMTNVILARSPAGNCSLKDPAIVSFSLSSDGTCNFGGAADNVAVNVGKLDSNGGSLPTSRLLPGSPAIDGGNLPACTARDERGFTRPRGGSCDVGAVEFQPCAGKPAAASLPQPATGATASSVGFLDWVGADCTRTFNLVVRRGSTSGPIVYSTTGLVDSSRHVPALTGAHTWFWRVLSCRGSSCTAGPWWRFTTR
jgi:hypothetical protein